MVKKMFQGVSRTWNPVIGCQHNCSYCWARKLAREKLKHLPRYQEGFEPKLIEKELLKTFKPGEFVFVSSMGDLWGAWVPKEWQSQILRKVAQFPNTIFLFQTKNPSGYRKFSFPSNTILGITIETDRYPPVGISRAPAPEERIEIAKELSKEGKRIAISIEPVIIFDFPRFVTELVKINPEIIWIGYDNYEHKLPEPSLLETKILIRFLKNLGFRVSEKTIRRAWWEPRS